MMGLALAFWCTYSLGYILLAVWSGSTDLAHRSLADSDKLSMQLVKVIFDLRRKVHFVTLRTWGALATTWGLSSDFVLRPRCCH